MQIASAKRADEIGAIGRAVEDIKTRIASDAEQRQRSLDERRTTEQTARSELLHRLAAGLEETVGAAVGDLTAQIAELKSGAEVMEQQAAQTQSRSDRVAKATDSADGAVKAVASAAEQLELSIREISQLMNRSHELVSETDQRAGQTSSTIESLSASADSIGEVLALIGAIADQTNLLALNATIEAARAGESGKGFAVVAQEVKQLAKQTSDATQKIGKQIDLIRGGTAATVEAMREIRARVNQISSAVAGMASAVEEQSAATAEIAFNARQAQAGTSHVVGDIAQLSGTVAQTMLRPTKSPSARHPLHGRQQICTPVWADLSNRSAPPNLVAAPTKAAPLRRRGRSAKLRVRYRVTGMIRVGIGGWTFEPWRGVFYPPGLKHADELGYASRRVTTIEVNGTFYRTQTPASFRKWAAETPEDFVFSIKGSRFVTNRTKLAEAGPSIAKFFDSGVTELGPKLGPILWQFAPTKTFVADDFGAFLDLLPREVHGLGDPARGRGAARQLSRPLPSSSF